MIKANGSLGLRQQKSSAATEGFLPERAVGGLKADLMPAASGAGSKAFRKLIGPQNLSSPPSQVGCNVLRLIVALANRRISCTLGKGKDGKAPP
jgi:hypothetical protein